MTHRETNPDLFRINDSKAKLTKSSFILWSVTFILALFYVSFPLIFLELLYNKCQVTWEISYALVVLQEIRRRYNV